MQQLKNVDLDVFHVEATKILPYVHTQVVRRLVTNVVWRCGTELLATSTVLLLLSVQLWSEGKYFINIFSVVCKNGIKFTCFESMIRLFDDCFDVVELPQRPQ